MEDNKKIKLQIENLENQISQTELDLENKKNELAKLTKKYNKVPKYYVIFEDDPKHVAIAGKWNKYIVTELDEKPEKEFFKSLDARYTVVKEVTEEDFY
jgi:uncharacterized ferritin-like protein (DUF455 family)